MLFDFILIKNANFIYFLFFSMFFFFYNKRKQNKTKNLIKEILTINNKIKFSYNNNNTDII